MRSELYSNGYTTIAMAEDGKRECVLGIDIGTTSVKVSLVDIESKRALESVSRETKAFIVSDLGHQGNEQDVQKICEVLQFCVSQLIKDTLYRITKIGVSGQMHGAVLWKHGECWKQDQVGFYEPKNVSRLYTWQDGRCTPEFLSALPKCNSHLGLSTGHGCATLFWLKRYRPDFISNFDRAGTIQDFVVAMICGLDMPIMSIQNAASWGYVDTDTKSWNKEILAAAAFPVHLLPIIISSHHPAGVVHSSWCGIRKGTTVGAAFGDMQCSVLSALQADCDAVLNIGTSAQLSFIMPEEFVPKMSSQQSSIEFFPYFNGRYLAVAASLNGGNAMAAFVHILQQWTDDLGVLLSEDKIWEKVLFTAQDDDCNAKSELVIVPTLFGERHLPNQRASVSNIDSTNASLGKVSRSLCKGIVKNIHDMMPCKALVEAGMVRLIGTGSALLRNVGLQKEVEEQYQLPIIYRTGCDAAFGAALAILTHS